MLKNSHFSVCPPFLWLKVLIISHLCKQKNAQKVCILSAREQYFSASDIYFNVLRLFKALLCTPYQLIVNDLTPKIAPCRKMGVPKGYPIFVTNKNLGKNLI